MAAVSFRNVRGRNLCGKLVAASPDNIVIMTHGFTSDKTSRGRFDYTALCLKERGFSSLAFDFSGCGESDDDTLTVAKQIEDLRSAAAFVMARGYRRLALWGNSLGTRICLEAGLANVWAMVLTGAGTGPMAYDWNAYFSPEQLAELSRTGQITIPLDDGPRRQIVIEGGMLDEFATMDQQAVLSAVRCPVLIIHGDGDDEERSLAELSRRGLSWLPHGSRLDVLSGAKHGFLGHLDHIVRVGGDWLVEHLPRE